MKDDMPQTVKQLSVFIENRSGALAAFVRLLRDHGIDMRALSLAESAEFGVLRAIVSDPEKALEVLDAAGSTCAITPVIAVAVPDAPGALCNILDIFDAAAINLEYAYAFTTRRKHGAYMVVRVAEPHIRKAVALLEGQGIDIVSGEDIYGL